MIKMENIINCFVGDTIVAKALWNYIIPLLIVSVCCYVGIKRFTTKFINNHGLIVAVFAFIIIEFYLFSGPEHFLKVETWQALFDNILSGALFAILSLFFWKVEKSIKNQYEDKTKLTTDYKSLAKKYKKDNLVVAINADGNEVKYPIINLGECEITLSNAEENDRVIILDDKTSYYQLPAIVEANFNALFAAHDTSKIYNNVNIRVTNMFYNNEGKVCFSTERTMYYYSLVTNRAADYKIMDSLSVRELLECGPKMTNLSEAMLSNHLGFNGFVESADGYIVFVRRSNGVSIGKRTYGNSIGASMKTKYALDECGNLTYPGFREAIIKEIEDELKIEIDDLYLNTLSLFALYRDCVECGKPQFLMYVKSKKTAAEITRNFKNKSKEKLREKLDSIWKLGNKQGKELLMLIDGKKLIWIQKDILRRNVVYGYNGITAKKAWVRFGKFNDKPKKVFGSELSMVPSASAAVYLFSRNLSAISEEPSTSELTQQGF